MTDAELVTTRRVSRNDLILEDVFRLSIQLVSQLVDPGNLILR